MGKFAWLSIISGFMLVVVLVIIHSISPNEHQLVKSELPVTIGIQDSALSALFIVAKEQHLFAKHRVSVQFEHYPSGKNALEAMLSHKVDFAVSSNIPILYHSFFQPNMTVIATVEKSRANAAVLVRMGRGVYVPKDLSGKRIAVEQNSNDDYFTYLFLTHYGITLKDVTMVYLPTVKLVMSLNTGYVDAVVLHEPYIHQAEFILPNQVLEWQLPVNDQSYFNLVTTRSFIHLHRGRVKHILAALKEAVVFVKKHHKTAQQDVIRYLGEERRDEVLSMWPSLCFCVSLDQKLIIDMRKQLAWLMTQGSVTGRRVPSLDTFIDKSLLTEVMPGVVKLKPLLG